MAELIAPEAQKTEEKQTISPEDQQNQDVVKRVKRLLKQSQEASKDLRQEWSKNYDFVVKGKQWDIRRPRWRFSEVVNLTWADIMMEVGIQTDGRPKVDFQATEPSDQAFAEVLKEVNDVNWSKPLNTGFGWSSKVESKIFKSKLYHVVHSEVKWDKRLENGIGDVKFDILDPYGCYWDPTADNIGDCRYFIYAKPTPVAELKKKYPDKAEKIKTDVNFMGAPDAANGEYNQDFGFTSSGPLSLLHGDKTERPHMSSNEYGGEEMALLLRVWLRDDTTIEELVKTEEGEDEYVTKLQYPKGRYLEIVGNCLLKDEGEGGQADPVEPNIYEDGKFPICTLVNYNYGEYAGENEVTHRKGLQKLLNYTLSHIADQFKMGSNPQKIVHPAAQNAAKKLTNEPGLVAVMDPQHIRYETGPGIASGSFNLLDTVVSLFDKVGGLQDVTRGASQPGVTSGLMLEGFVEAAQTRPRLKNRNVDEFLTQMGYLCASRYLQFYKAPRMFRVTNKEGFPEYVEFFLSGEGDDRVANVRRMDADGVEFQNQTLSAKGLPDVKPVSGSNLPFAKALKTSTALDLQGRGSITNLSMLEAINWPNAKAEDEKVKKEQAELAAMQQQGAPQ